MTTACVADQSECWLTACWEILAWWPLAVALSSLQKNPNVTFALWVQDPYLIHGSLGPPESTSGSRSVQVLLQGLRSWPTDKPRYSICNNRPHLLWCSLMIIIIIIIMIITTTTHVIIIIIQFIKCHNMVKVTLMALTYDRSIFDIKIFAFSLKLNANIWHCFILLLHDIIHLSAAQTKGQSSAKFK